MHVEHPSFFEPRKENVMLCVQKAKKKANKGRKNIPFLKNAHIFFCYGCQTFFSLQDFKMSPKRVTIIDLRMFDRLLNFEVSEISGQTDRITYSVEETSYFMMSL